MLLIFIFSIFNMIVTQNDLSSFSNRYDVIQTSLNFHFNVNFELKK
jgi:hypothetical protein